MGLSFDLAEESAEVDFAGFEEGFAGFDFAVTLFGLAKKVEILGGCVEVGDVDVCV